MQRDLKERRFGGETLQTAPESAERKKTVFCWRVTNATRIDADVWKTRVAIEIEMGVALLNEKERVRVRVCFVHL